MTTTGAAAGYLPARHLQQIIWDGCKVIYTKLEKLGECLREEVRPGIEAFLKGIRADMADGEYEILGTEAFARVQTYGTVSPEEGKIEAHDVYADIQGSICGAEGISVYDRECLCPSGPYDGRKDVRHYDPDGAVPLVRTSNLPGYAAVLLPGDAHRPKERVGDIREVKKFVIKVKAGYVDGL